MRREVVTPAKGTHRSDLDLPPGGSIEERIENTIDGRGLASVLVLATTQLDVVLTERPSAPAPSSER